MAVDRFVLHFENLKIIFLIQIEIGNIANVAKFSNGRYPFRVCHPIAGFWASLFATGHTNASVVLIVAVCMIFRTLFQAVGAVFVCFFGAAGQAVV